MSRGNGEEKKNPPPWPKGKLKNKWSAQQGRSSTLLALQKTQNTKKTTRKHGGDGTFTMRERGKRQQNYPMRG